MPLALFKDLSRPKLMDIIMLLKRSPGMSVSEMSGALLLSYMGVKQNCNYLEKLGYLDFWMRSKSGGGGRPEKMYRLTHKMDALFPNSACDLALDMLEAARQSGGWALVDPLLKHHFDKKAARYAEKVSGRTLLERVQSFAKLRMEEGCVSSCDFSAQDGLCLIEYHSSISQLCLHYPQVAMMESMMISSVLGCEVERLEKRMDRLTRYEFRLKAKPVKAA